MTLNRLIAVAAFAVLCAGVATAQKPVKLKETVEFATSWDAAVEEAKLLNLPLVVHSHGFY